MGAAEKGDEKGGDMMIRKKDARILTFVLSFIPFSR